MRLVLDLETVTNDVPTEGRPSELAHMLQAFAKPYPVGERSPMDTEIEMLKAEAFASRMLEGQTEEFPPPACWTIVSAATVLLSERGEFQRMGIVHGSTEREIVENLVGLVEDKSTTLVTWNGRRFDVPILEARCLHFGLPIPSFSRGWRYRYSDEHHYDVKDYLAGFGAASSTSLNQMSRLVGLPGKPDGVDGSQVATMMKEPGGLARVQAYNLSDAVQTAGVMLRADLMRGRLTLSEARDACHGLMQACSQDPRVAWVSDKANHNVFLLKEAS
jgi:predicted PolB exonuclease-like 3'-5' exonuclease